MEIYTLLIGIGTISMVGMFLLIVFFGRLMKIQLKFWFLRKRGYALIEHIVSGGVRQYYFLRAKDGRFLFNGGFYISDPEKMTRATSLFPNPPLLKKLSHSPEFDMLRAKIDLMQYDSSVAKLRWGCPIYTFYGDTPHPLNFKNVNEEMDHASIKELFNQLISQTRFKLLKKIMTIFFLTTAVAGIGMIAYFFVFRGNGNIANTCLDLWNASQTSLIQCVNSSGYLQNSTVIV